MAGTKLRNVRISDDVWIPAKNKAERLGDSLTNVVRRGLQHYIEGEPPFVLESRPDDAE